ncbi:MAG TPA: GNAT family N-acetyltransferase [Nitriliruptoraceae bacterium]|nr:GNAT family N-acetyltransferase [Nitriliruptoraceae bacterium]
MRREVQVGDYRIVGDPASLDMELAHRALSRESYWARGRSREDHDRAFASSRVAVALDAAGATVAFARAVTDGVTHAWLADVWVEPDHRGRGLGTAVTEFLVDAPDLADVGRWALVTSSAQQLYRRLGFTDYEAPPTLMQRRRP